MLEPEEHLHQFTTAAIAATIGRAKRLTDLHCMHSSRVDSLGLKSGCQINGECWGRDGFLSITFATSFASKVLLLPATARVDA